MSNQRDQFFRSISALEEYELNYFFALNFIFALSGLLSNLNNIGRSSLNWVLQFQRVIFFYFGIISIDLVCLTEESYV